MKRVAIGIILVGILALTPVAGAQALLKFDAVQIQFWPEYDRPEMLVIYTIELPAEQSLPVEVSVRIPARVNNPTAVAVLEGNQLVTREYSLAAGDDWTIVTLTTDSPVIQMEYYDPLLSQADQPRDFTFEWMNDYPVDELVIGFKQPVHATDIVFSLDLGAPETGEDGLDYYITSLGDLPADEAFTFSIQYQKSDDLLSAEVLTQPQTGTAPSTEAPVVSQNTFPTWGWYIVGVGAVILAGGGVYLWYLNTPTAFSRYRQKKARSSSSRQGVRDGVFCHQCGTRAGRGDKFCRNCGQKIRN